MVPLNYSSGRLFCKFSILLLSIFLLFWIFLEKQQLSVKTEDLQVQLRFANEHISSLSAQINGFFLIFCLIFKRGRVRWLASEMPQSYPKPGSNAWTFLS